jgi:Arm DNA-binding domain
MARIIGPLTALKVAHARDPGMLADGDGLYLQVSNASSKSWIFRYRRNGKQREMGLGPLKGVSLAAAREKARGCRAKLADGIDPLVAREAVRVRNATDNAKVITFDQCAEAFIKAHGDSWKNAKHLEQWENTLATYVSPVFGSLPVQAIDVGLV